MSVYRTNGPLVSEQYLIYNIGLVPSKFYKVLGSKDSPGFWRETVLAVILIVSEAFVSNVKLSLIMKIVHVFRQDMVLLLWIEALLPSKQFFSHVGMFSWVEPD